MPRPVRRIDIYLPLYDNHGRPVRENKFEDLEDELVDRFGGATSVQRSFPLRGLWRSPSDEVFQDWIVVLSSLDLEYEKELDILRYLTRLKGRLMKEIAQLDILITLQDLLAV